MAAPKAPVLDVTGKKSKDLTLEASVFAVELKPHLVHETVRAELNARRAGTHAAKSRGFDGKRPLEAVAAEGNGPRPRGHDSRQVPRAAVSRSPAPRATTSRSTRKCAAPRCAPRCPRMPAGARSASSRTTCSTRRPPRTASELLGTWGKDFPLLVIAEVEQENVVKSFRNLPSVFVVTSAETGRPSSSGHAPCSRPRPRCSSSRGGPK